MRKLPVLLACLWSCADVPAHFAPPTTCAPFVGAWQNHYAGGAFLDATLEPGGTVAVLQQPDEGPGRIVRLDAKGQQVAVVNLPAEATKVFTLAALPDGGWLAFDWTVRRLDATGTLRWSFGADPQWTSLRPATVAPDGTILVLGTVAGGGVRWVRLDAGDGHVRNTVDWPGVDRPDVIVGLADGGVCATGQVDTQDSGWEDARMGCWTADGTVVARQVGPHHNMGINVGLRVWPDGTMRADVRSCGSGIRAQQVLQVDLPGLATVAVVDVSDSGICCCANTASRADLLALITPDPSGGMVDVRFENRWLRSTGLATSRTTWQRRGADGQLRGEVVLVDFRSLDKGGATLPETTGQDADVQTLLPMPDGGWWAIGASSETGETTGWIVRLPPGACAAAVQPRVAPAPPHG